MLVQEDGAGDLVGCAEGLEQASELCVYFDFRPLGLRISH